MKVIFLISCNFLVFLRVLDEKIRALERCLLLSFVKEDWEHLSVYVFGREPVKAGGMDECHQYFAGIHAVICIISEKQRDYIFVIMWGTLQPKVSLCWSGIPRFI